MKQSTCDFILECHVPPFEIKNVYLSRHDILQIFSLAPNHKDLDQSTCKQRPQAPSATLPQYASSRLIVGNRFAVSQAMILQPNPLELAVPQRFGDGGTRVPSRGDKPLQQQPRMRPP